MYWKDEKKNPSKICSFKPFRACILTLLLQKIYNHYNEETHRDWLILHEKFCYRQSKRISKMKTQVCTAIFALTTVHKSNAGTVYLLNVLFSIWWFCFSRWNVWISQGHNFTPIHLQLWERPVGYNYILKSDRRLTCQKNCLIPDNFMTYLHPYPAKMKLKANMKNYCCS